jgi:hypothetical protein
MAPGPDYGHRGSHMTQPIVRSMIGTALAFHRNLALIAKGVI